MDIKKLLQGFNLEEEVLNSIVDKIKVEIPKEFVGKQQYSKKVAQLDTLQENINDLEAKLENSATDEYKTKFETVEKEFNDFKQNIETEKVNSEKSGLLKEALKHAGIENDTLLRFALTDFNLDTLVVEEGKLKDFDTTLDKYKNDNSDLFTKIEKEGHSARENFGVVGNNEKNDPLADALSKYL